MTGAAPIYLVSACTSGEEFVAAFRRYADKTGLFIPISQPLATGRRSRFAVTLKDGGVMIEGEAEVISSAMTASVLHGRVGMTLRFIAPDEASKTTLGELERARLAMKPPPPSIPPRPAEIPAEPRPVPPPIQGRIDAVNALAECVAIGDPEPLPLAAPARPGLKTMTGVPPMRPRSPSAPPPPASTPSRGAHPTGSLPVATPERTEPPASSEPAPTDGAPIVERGPISDTYITAMPPTPTELDLASPVAPRLASEMPVAVPRTPTKPGVTPAAAPAAPGPIAIARDARDSETMTAVPAPRPATPSSPTQVGVVIADLAPRDPAIPIIEGVHDDPSARTQVSVSAPTPEPASPGEPSVSAAPEPPAPPAEPPVAPEQGAPEVEIAEPTDLSAGPPDPTTPVRSPEVADAPRHVPASLLPSAQDAGELAETTETAEIAEPQGTSPDRAATSPDDARSASHAPAPPSDEAGLRARRTVLGIAPARRQSTPVPTGAAVAVPVIPATPVMRKTVSVPDDVRAIHHATPRAAPPVPVSPELTPVDGWTLPADVQITYSTAPSGSAPGMPLPSMPMANVPAAGSAVASPSVAGLPVASSAVESPPGASLPAAPGAGMPDTPVEARGPAMAAASAAAAVAARPGSAASPVLPSGDWTIARDPDAPDGWSAPFTSAPAHHLGEPRPMPPIVASAEPLDSNAPQPPLRPDEMPMLEPKVQIDPTLIEPLPGPLSGPVPGQLIDPLQAMPAHEPYPIAPSPGMPGYGMAGALPEAPPMNMMMAVPQPGPYHMQAAPMHAAPMHASTPGYAIDPGYQMHGMPVPHDATYASDHALRAATARRRAIIVLVAALAVVLIGIVVLLVRGDSHRRPAGSSDGAAPPIAPAPRASHRPPQSAAPVAADTAPAEPAAPGAPAASDSVPAADTAPASSAAPSAPSSAGAVSTPTGAATPRPGGVVDGECFADVTSVPIGADIVIDQTNVIGMTPDRVELPCGAPVELLIRKGRLISATRTITPTPDGAKVKVTLTKQTLLVKVSSTPPGATITLYGRPLGVTPTTVKVPAFESSTLTITKDGYTIATERVAPKINGTAVHTTLTRLERSRR